MAFAYEFTAWTSHESNLHFPKITGNVMRSLIITFALLFALFAIPASALTGDQRSLIPNRKPGPLPE